MKIDCEASKYGLNKNATVATPMTREQQRFVYATLLTVMFMVCPQSNPETAFIAQEELVGNAVLVYEFKDFDGVSQAFEAGIFRADEEHLTRIGNDSISSLKVAEGYRLKVCQSEGDGHGSDGCETYTAGNYATLTLNNLISFLEISEVSHWSATEQ
jgi:hypothetical protein